MTVVRIGLDIAKHVFQVHGVAEDNRVLVRRQLRRTQVVAWAFAVSRWNRSMPRISPLGAGPRRAWASSTFDAAAIRKALRQAPKERCCRR